jgi:hypothetical protein
MRHLHLRILTATLPFLLSMPYGAAQPVQAPTRAEAQAALNPPPAPERFTKAQLDQMLAPIALYPDQLLTQLLMAATFPDQLVDAAKWLQDGRNADLKGDDLALALEPLPWDPSVKSLVPFPQVIAMMTDHLDWTETLGTAFANQEVEVFSRVQFLRDQAVKAGKLKSSSQIVVREQASDIIIEPADPNLVYVPVYNPAEVYGTWPDPGAPPVYVPPPPRYYSGPVGAGIAFAAGVGVAAGLWNWGHPDWRRHAVVIDPDRYRHITGPNGSRETHVTIEGRTWRHTGPVTFVPEAHRPRPPQPSGQLPTGTIRPSEVPHPRGPGFEHGPPGQVRPAQSGGQPGERRPDEARPGAARPSDARPNEGRPSDARPNEGRPSEARPNEARPNEGRPNEGRPNEARPNHARPNEVRPDEARPGPGESRGPVEPSRAGEASGSASQPPEGHSSRPAHPAPAEARPARQEPPQAHPGPGPGEAHPQPPQARPGPTPSEAHPQAPQPPQARPAPAAEPHPQPAAEPHPQPAAGPQPHPGEGHPQPPQARAPQPGPPPPAAHPQGPPPQGGQPAGGPPPQQGQHREGQHPGGSPGDKKPGKGDDDKH